MNLFSIINDNIRYSEEVLLLKPFNNIWKKDKTKGKILANAELAAVFFYADYKSDFSQIINEEEKLATIKQYIVGLPKDWQPDKSFNEAVDFYKERQKTLSVKLLESVRRAMDKISQYFDTVDLHKVDKQGKLLFNVAQFSAAIKNAGEMTESHNKLENQVKKELTEKKESVGSKNKNLFEDGL